MELGWGLPQQISNKHASPPGKGGVQQFQLSQLIQE